MTWKRKRLLYFVISVIAPLLFWWGVTSIFGTDHEALAGVLYAVYLFGLNLLFNIYQGQTWGYTLVLGAAGTIWLLATGFQFVWASSDSIAASYTATFNLVLAVACTLVAVGVSVLAYLLVHLVSSIRDLRD